MCAAATAAVHIPLLPDPRPLAAPRAGPLYGRAVLVIVAPTGCAVGPVKQLWRALRPLGVRVAVTSECHGEALGERRRRLFPNQLLVEVAPERWDALVIAGGGGAARVAEDPLALARVRQFAALGRPVAALGAGARVLERAGVDGPRADDGVTLACVLAPLFAEHGV
jgi:putative intracellular protease/amidase